ncbi:MAG: M23 family metallopeptidase [Candidatus Sumerlaea chitinivorans]|nr:M23 family metallopeptidase [Candidatus Sumerlaea chitinivorans]
MSGGLNHRIFIVLGLLVLFTEFGPAASQKSLAPQVLGIRVVGTASFQDRKTALIYDENSQTEAFFRVGDLLYGYRILDIAPTLIVLEKGGIRYDMAFQPMPLAPPSVAPPSPSPRIEPNIYGQPAIARAAPNLYVPPSAATQWDRWAAPPAAPSTAIATELGGRFAFPLQRYKRVSSPFGYRRHPIRGGVRMHKGIDLASWTGTKIFAADSGTVIHSGWLGGYGYCVMVDHHNGYVTVYGHCSRLLVDVGDNVRRGDYIAQVGSTGASTGPHLHFEVRRNGVPIDPAPFLRKGL